MSTAYTLQQLADMLAADVHGDATITVTHLANLATAGSGAITFCNEPKRRAELEQTQATAVIVSPKMLSRCPTNALVTSDPYLAYAKVAAILHPADKPVVGIHPSAVVADTAIIASTVSIGPNAVIADHVSIGDQVVIGAGCSVGKNVKIGEHCQLHANVTLYHGVELGQYVTLHSGVVIGADGFGYAPSAQGWQKIPQLGRVIIGNHVEIGANTCIDRGALNDTVIKDGVIIDNLVMIAHNCEIGENTAIAGCTAIAGSAKIGKNVRIGGAACINGHLEVADGSTIVGTTTVSKSLKDPDIYVSGTGMAKHRDWRRNMVRFHQLDKMAKRLAELEKKLVSMEAEA